MSCVPQCRPIPVSLGWEKTVGFPLRPGIPPTPPLPADVAEGAGRAEEVDWAAEVEFVRVEWRCCALNCQACCASDIVPQARGGERVGGGKEGIRILHLFFENFNLAIFGLDFSWVVSERYKSMTERGAVKLETIFFPTRFRKSFVRASVIGHRANSTYQSVESNLGTLTNDSVASSRRQSRKSLRFDFCIYFEQRYDIPLTTS